MKLMNDGYKELGEVFTVPIFHKRITFLLGPDVAPHFFKGTDDEMSQTEVQPTLMASILAQHSTLVLHTHPAGFPLILRSPGLQSTFRSAPLTACGCACLNVPIFRQVCPATVQVYAFNVPTFGKGVVYDVDQKTRTGNCCSKWLSPAAQLGFVYTCIKHKSSTSRRLCTHKHQTCKCKPHAVLSLHALLTQSSSAGSQRHLRKIA